MTVRYDDIHRVYSPLRRLASVDMLRSYCACGAEPPRGGACAGGGGGGAVSGRGVGSSPPPGATLSTLLADFVRRRVAGESYMRDACDVVWRPLGVALPDDFLSRAPSRPADLAALLAGSAVDRRRPASGREQQGVTRAAIEVTRGCDELSGRLLRTGEFDPSAVNGHAATCGSRNTKALSLTQSTDETITEV